MLKSLMQGAPFASTVAAANTQLQNVLNTGKMRAKRVPALW